MTTIQVYTDGSCLGNPGPGGWAYIIRDGERDIEGHGSERVTTNNRMELMAAIQALSLLPDSRSVVLHSDSQLLIKTMTLGWKRKKNQDLWDALDRLCARRQITWQWVRGHNGHRENERCDRLAQRAAQTARQPMRAMLVIVVSLLLLSCTGTPSPFQPTVDQGLALMKRVTFESPPEDKLRTAQELLAHAEQYERQITASSPSDIRREAQRLRRGERATASILMRDAASDYAKQQQPDKARDVYRSVLSTFTEEYEASFRESAEASLKGLGPSQAK